jgi:hypothetical protein
MQVRQAVMIELSKTIQRALPKKQNKTASAIIRQDGWNPKILYIYMHTTKRERETDHAGSSGRISPSPIGS